MSVCDEWIEKVSKKLPDDCTTLDLVRAGIFTSPHSASLSRKIGKSPPYLKLGKRIMYPKDGVIKWLNTLKYENT